jgi:two-component system cell cycle response regulator DivK
VAQTGDGLQAINLALAHLPDLILMDIQLPEISGLEMTRRLRGDDRSRHIPIVAATAFAMGWHKREALDNGQSFAFVDRRSSGRSAP